MRNRHAAAVCAALFLASWPAGSASKPELEYVVILARHGVRSPTWENTRLNEYSVEPWPEWGVPPGYLTLHGREALLRLGSYYREWLVSERLLHVSGCQDISRTYIWADKEQRTLESARALAEALVPGCGIEIHQQQEGRSDPIFSGFGSADPESARDAVRKRIGPDPQNVLTAHRAALDTLQYILGRKTPEPDAIDVGIKGKAVEITGPLATGSTFSENLLLEYANGFEGAALGWGRLNVANLERVLELHAVYADLTRRTPYVARRRGSNLLSHILNSLEQAAANESKPGALGGRGDAVLLLAGHDTNLSNVSGMLGLSWKLPGYQPDDTPPGGALVFLLWRDPGSGRRSLELRYVAQGLEQMRHLTPLSVAVPPEQQDVLLPGCGAMVCAWEMARGIIRKAIDTEFVD